MFFLATSYDHFNYFTFPKRSWGEVTSFIPTGAKCIDVFDLKQHRADDQRMTSKYRESDSKVCFSVALAVRCLVIQLSFCLRALH